MNLVGQDTILCAARFLETPNWLAPKILRRSDVAYTLNAPVLTSFLLMDNQARSVLVNKLRSEQ